MAEDKEITTPKFDEEKFKEAISSGITSQISATLEELASLPDSTIDRILSKLSLKDDIRRKIKSGVAAIKIVSPSKESELERMREEGFYMKHFSHPHIIPVLIPDDLEEFSVLIRVNEEPLTLQNLAAIFSALTELSTKYWLISQGCYSCLIEYTQTRNPQYAEEAKVIIARITHNSPMNFDIRFSASDVANAFITTLDGLKQANERLEKEKLANQAALQEIQRAEQESEQSRKMSELEQEKKRQENEEQRLKNLERDFEIKKKEEEYRLSILERQLELQKKSVEIALELANKVVDTLNPTTDPAARTMMIQSFLPNILQLQSVKGLELVFELPQSESDEQTPPDLVEK